MKRKHIVGLISFAVILILGILVYKAIITPETFKTLVMAWLGVYTAYWLTGFVLRDKVK